MADAIETNIDSIALALDVALYLRHPRGGAFSIERVFRDVRAAMPPDVQCRTVVSPFESRGIVDLLRCIRFARQQQGEINHITGDIHYAALGLSRSRTILSIHDCRRYFMLRGLRRLLYRILWFDLPLAHCAQATVISEATKRELLRVCPWLPAGRVSVVPDPVSPAFRPAPTGRTADVPRILQVGTAPNKNVLRVAAALSGIPCELRIIGGVSQDLRRALAKEGVNWSASERLSDSELVGEYRDCDLVVFASTYEGFGLPIVEAQATGRPVITSALLSMPEVAGDGAVFVDPFAVDSIRDGIRRVLDSQQLRDQLVERGLKNVKRFEPEIIAKRYREIYLSVLKRGRRNAAAR